MSTVPPSRDGTHPSQAPEFPSVQHQAKPGGVLGWVSDPLPSASSGTSQTFKSHSRLTPSPSPLPKQIAGTQKVNSGRHAFLLVSSCPQICPKFKKREKAKFRTFTVETKLME